MTAKLTTAQQKAKGYKYNIYTGQSLGGGSTKTSSGSSGSDSVKALQRALNAKGANLKVDGIAGPLTKAAQLKFGGASNALGGMTRFSGSSSGSMSKPSKPVVGMSKPGASYSLSSAAKDFKTKQEELKKRNAINLGATALDAPFLESYKLPDGSTKYQTMSSFLPTEVKNSNRDGSTLVDAFQASKQAVSNLFSGSPRDTFSASTTSANTTQPGGDNLISSDGTFIESGGALNPDLTGEGNLDTNISSQTTETPTPSSSSTPEEITTTDPKTDEVTIDEGNQQQMMFNIATTGINNILNSFSTGMKTGSAWESNSGKGLGDNFQGGETIVVANQLADILRNMPENDMYAYLASPQGQLTMKPFLDKGGNMADVLKKTQPTVHGILPPQTFAEFDAMTRSLDSSTIMTVEDYMRSKFTGVGTELLNTKNVPDELKAFIDAKNKESIMASTHLNQYEKMLHANAYNDMLVAVEEIKATRQLMEARETAIERKTELAIEEARAEMKKQEAETEQSRITSMDYAKGMLAKMGALDVSGAAVVGLENLEQKYQEQKSLIRAKYNSYIGNLQADADEKLADLRYALQKDTLEAYKDFNKSDREIRLELFKLNNDYQMDVLKSNTQYSEKLSDLKTKNKGDSMKLTKDYLKSFYSLSGWNQFESMDEDYQNTWIQNAEEAMGNKGSWLNQLKPGSISKSNVDKSAEDFYGGSTVDNSDPLGVL